MVVKLCITAKQKIQNGFNLQVVAILHFKNLAINEKLFGKSKQSLFSLAQSRPTTQQQFLLCEVKQQLAKIATGCNLSQVVVYVTFLVATRRFASSVNAP